MGYGRNFPLPTSPLIRYPRNQRILGHKIPKWTSANRAGVSGYSDPNSRKGGETEATKTANVIPTNKSKGCCNVKLSGGMSLDIHLNVGHPNYGTPDAVDDQGRSFIDHEYVHVGIHVAYWNQMADLVNGVERDYCCKCAEIAVRGAKAVIKISYAQAAQANARFDLAAYSSQMTQQEIDKLNNTNSDEIGGVQFSVNLLEARRAG